MGKLGHLQQHHKRVEQHFASTKYRYKGSRGKSLTEILKGGYQNMAIFKQKESKQAKEH